MADVSLVWFMLEETDVIATRTQMLEVAARLELPGKTGSRDSKVAAFLKACKTTITYVDSTGQHRVLLAREAKRTVEFITYQIQRDDGFKVAEYKFFQSRRNRTGVVRGTHVVRTVLRRGLEPAEMNGARAWIETASAVYEQLQEDAPWRQVRHQAREAILSVGVPIEARESMYFVYDDDIDVVGKTREFIAACTDRLDFTVVAVDDFSDYSVFARSADLYLTHKAGLLITRLHNALSGRMAVSIARRDGLTTTLARIREQQSRHERRLNLPLTQTCSTLLIADQLVSELPV